MASIDFYLLSQEGAQARFLFACRLLEKAYSQQHQIYVHLESAEKAQLLNQLLWTFRDESFIPHALYNPAQESSSPILLGHNPTAAQHNDILLNLHPEVPAFHGNFKRILEVISAETALRQVAEERRSFYETQGYKVTQHQLKQ